MILKTSHSKSHTHSLPLHSESKNITDLVHVVNFHRTLNYFTITISYRVQTMYIIMCFIITFTLYVCAVCEHFENIYSLII